jgi:DNA-binding HxlR family transcriptional regulator
MDMSVDIGVGMGTSSSLYLEVPITSLVMASHGYGVQVPARSYQQYCGAAAALDAVGERWSLLVVRELLDGPKRYSDLLAGLPGVATDVLAARLRHLEAEGVVRRRALAPPAASRVYELTPDGRRLEPALLELTRWGLARLDSRPPEGSAFRAHWLSLPLRAMFRPGRVGGRTLVVNVVVDGEPVTVHVDDGGVSVTPGASPDATVTVSGSVEALAALARGTSPAEGARRTEVTGPPADVAALNAALGLA